MSVSLAPRPRRSRGRCARLSRRGRGKILGLTVQPITGTHLRALTQLKNPFVQMLQLGLMMANAKKAAEKKQLQKRAEAFQTTEDDFMEAFYIFTLTPDQVRAALADANNIRPEALKLLDTLPPVPVEGFLGAALAEHYIASFATSVQFKAPDKPGTVTFPPPGPARQTGSAGS